MAAVLITGAGGLIGSALSKKLRLAGHSVKTLSTNIRHKDGQDGSYFWNIDEGFIQPNALDGVEVMIHLAGMNIGNNRWTAKNRREFITSRAGGSRLLLQEIKKGNCPVKHFISAGGIGFYPDPCEKLLDENEASGNGFISQICREWENAAHEFEQTGCKVSIMRTGPVLSAHGGLYRVITRTLPFRILPVLGSKKNMLSWIHIDDAVSAYMHVIENGIEGTFNLNAEPVSQIRFLNAIAGNTFCFYPVVPAFLLWMALGERSALPLSNQRVSSDKLVKTGFHFQYPGIQSAIQALKNE